MRGNDGAIKTADPLAAPKSGYETQTPTSQGPNSGAFFMPKKGSDS